MEEYYAKKKKQLINNKYRDSITEIFQKKKKIKKRNYAKTIP